MRSPDPYRFGTALIVILAASAACSSGPTAREIDEGLDAELSSVAGDWTGLSSGADQGVLRLTFRLNEGSGNSVSGTGTMQEGGGATPVPIAVTGSYVRPVLTLTFGGMVFDGRAVQGSFSGRYTTVGGISDALLLTATSYTRSIPVLLQEQ